MATPARRRGTHLIDPDPIWLMERGDDRCGGASTGVHALMWAILEDGLRRIKSSIDRFRIHGIRSNRSARQATLYYDTVGDGTSGQEATELNSDKLTPRGMQDSGLFSRLVRKLTIACSPEPPILPQTLIS